MIRPRGCFAQASPSLKNMPAKGVSNNPAGRTPGVGAAALLRRALASDGDLTKLVKKVRAQALAGCTISQKMLLDRCIPVLKTQSAPVQVDLPGDSLTEQARALLNAAAAGELPADVASELIRAVAGVVAVEQGDELRRRLDALEHGDLA